MVSIFYKIKRVCTILLLLSLITINRALASEQQGDDNDQVLALTILSADEENMSNDEGLSIDAQQHADQIAPQNNPRRSLLAREALLLIFYLDTTLVEIGYLMLSIRYLDPLLMCHGIVIFAALIRGITCLRNPTRAALLQLLILTCLSVVLGGLVKDKIFMMVRVLSGTEKKIEIKA